MTWFSRGLRTGWRGVVAQWATCWTATENPPGKHPETVSGAFDRKYSELMASIGRLERTNIVERTMHGEAR